LDVVEIAVGSLTGSSHTFTGVRLRTTGAAFAVEVEFSANNACVRTVAVPAVDNCAVICVPPTINAPSVTQPTCAVSTGTIVVNATGTGTLEYSINGGTSWSPTATFSGLAPGNYDIAVRLQSSPACVANYSSNPVVLTAATGCNTCVITCPANIVKNNTWGKCGANVTYPAATGTGNCGALIYSKASGSFFPVGVTTVTVTSTSGSSCSFTVTVKDVQKPDIKCPADIYVTTSTCSKAVTFNVTATDNCPGVTVTTVPASGSIFPAGTTTVTATATDAAGNKTTSTFKVKVKETRPPVIHLKSNPIVLQWPANGTYQRINVSQFVQSVSDNCSNIPVHKVNIIRVTSDEAEDAPGSSDGSTRKDIRISDDCKSVDLRRERKTGGNGRVYTIYVSVKDASGNTATASYKVYAPATQGGTTAGDNGTAYTVYCDCDDDDNDRNSMITGATASQSGFIDAVIPEGFVLEQNYPNPFSSATVIRFAIPEDATVNLAVYNNQGQLMAKLADGRMRAGNHEVKFDASKLAAGIYIYRLQTTDANGKPVMINRKMILSK
jgi:HYR domain/Secretion system C-terminal sorting domain